MPSCQHDLLAGKAGLNAIGVGAGLQGWQTVLGSPIGSDHAQLR